MVVHARSGGTIEVMGLMQGKTDGDAIIVIDDFALPVEGTETRVNNFIDYLYLDLTKAMEDSRKAPSVMAKLMGFDDTPPRQQPVSRQQRLLSENYLQKSASIGKRSRKDSPNSLLGCKKRANLRTNKDTLSRDFEQKSFRFDEMQVLSKDADVDEEMAEMIASKIESLSNQLLVFEEKLKMLLIPSDPLDTRNILLEVRAGTGGEEAGRWAADLVGPYVPEAERGGYKTYVMEVKGARVYSKLKYESGVHRVQRVPQTEAQGRIHTSTATVAIMPEVAASTNKEVDAHAPNYPTLPP
ncbi:hypothetical protein SSX86_030054 [Deinandra increscens subsp. villosa]|uniref:Peptide chain release factor domain-containing protein n=1 Tax=Deinandra increscens subsp. villosa TaxID=3103831 RepID=A0AAP0CG65_9ASTR